MKARQPLARLGQDQAGVRLQSLPPSTSLDSIIPSTPKEAEPGIGLHPCQDSNLWVFLGFRESVSSCRVLMVCVGGGGQAGRMWAQSEQVVT